MRYEILPLVQGVWGVFTYPCCIQKKDIFHRFIYKLICRGNAILSTIRKNDTGEKKSKSTRRRRGSENETTEMIRSILYLKYHLLAQSFTSSTMSRQAYIGSTAILSSHRETLLWKNALEKYFNPIQ